VPKYTIYFSAGVALEAKVLAGRLVAPGKGAPRRVLQLFRDDAAGRAAGTTFGAALAGANIKVEDYVISGDVVAAVRAALADAGPEDAVMFWFASADVARLDAIPPPTASTYFSAVLGGAERIPLPKSWRASASLVYPYELPKRRAANLAYFNAWINQRHLPLNDEIMQSEVYFAFAFLTDTVAEMLDNLHRDYLLERAESMIGKREGGKAEAEYYSSTQSHVRTQAQSADGRISAQPMSAEAPGLHALRLAGGSFGKREGTTAFPRLTLGPGQRFASKGAYVARFADDGTLEPVGGWVVP
jgi:hypothetical protein